MEKRLLRILKDRTFLLDMLTQHETTSPAFESSDDDLTDSSDGEMKMQHKSSDRKWVLPWLLFIKCFVFYFFLIAAFLLLTVARKKIKTERGTKKNPGIPSKPRRKPPNKLEKKNNVKPDAVTNLMMEDSLSSKQEATSKTGHMTPEEVVRHLESRRYMVHVKIATWWTLLSNMFYRAQQSQLEFSFAPDKAPATVPTEMFSNDIESEFYRLYSTNSWIT